MPHETLDITTTGRRSGQPRRIEIWVHELDGRRYLTGLPGRRGWYANLVAHPELIVHEGEDVRARARPVTDTAERRAILGSILASIDRAGELDRWLRDSPLVEVEPGGLD